MAKASKEIREELDEVEQKILKDKALSNEGNENFRGFLKLMGLGLGLGLAGATGLGFLTAAFGVGVPILDSLPMFQNKKRYKARLNNAKLRDEVALQRYKIAKQNTKNKVNQKEYNKDVSLRRNEPTPETVYDNLNMIKDNSDKQPVEEQAQKSKNNEAQKNQGGNNIQTIQNINGPVININGKEIDRNNVEIEERIITESELNAEINRINNQHLKEDNDNFNDLLIQGMKAIDDRIDFMRKSFGLENKEETETKQKPTVENILEDINKINDEDFEKYLKNKKRKEQESLKRAFNRASTKKSGKYKDLDEEQER